MHIFPSKVFHNAIVIHCEIAIWIHVIQARCLFNVCLVISIEILTLNQIWDVIIVIITLLVIFSFLLLHRLVALCEFSE